MACIASLASGALSGPGREAMAVHAIGFIRAAAREGFRDAAHVKADPDLVPLRGREDFQAVVAEMANPKESRSP